MTQKLNEQLLPRHREGIYSMAGSAQTRFGPRTVALSLKVFIVVLFYAHERFGLCTANRTLPEPLPGYLQAMTSHLCSESDQCKNSGNCEMGNSPNMLCQQICRSNCPENCWKTPKDAAPACRDNQNRICGYKDATVCEYRNGRGTCVYRKDPSRTFCICQDQEITYTRCVRADSNTTAIVLGSLFALLLLVVIIGAVVLCLRRQGRLPSFMKQTAKPAELSSVQLEARNATRAKLPDLPVPGGSTEYPYACDHGPIKEDSGQDDPTYYSVGEGGYPRYVLDGQRKTPATKELDTSTDNAKDPPHFVLNRNDENDEARNKSGGGHADGVKLTDSTTGVESKEANGEDYTSLVHTGNPKSPSEQSGKEVAVPPTLANENDVTSPIGSPTEGLSNGDDGTYFPLIQAAAPQSPLEKSGYEDAKIPTSESHDATLPTGVKSKSCDDDTYTPLVRTAEPKSQEKHSGYEAAIIPNPCVAADSDVTSPYDHLNRKEENGSKEGTLSTTDVDDYQHLVVN